MATTTRTQRRYDHRLQNLVRTTRDIGCALQRGVPRSTARGWLTDSDVPVVTVEALNLDATQLPREVLRLSRRVQKLIALLRVLLVVLRCPVIATSILFLAILGGFGGYAGGAPVIKAALRVAFWGILAMALTAGVGALFGASI